MATYLKRPPAKDVMREQMVYLFEHAIEGCTVPKCVDCERVRKMQAILFAPFEHVGPTPVRRQEEAQAA